MAIKIVDGSSVHKNFDGILKSFLPHAKKTLGYDKPVDIQLVSDPENAKDPFGKTAYYDPGLMKVTVFVDKRHVKDILRSISHELVHHKQNCEGRLHTPAGEGYAQNDPHLREMEGEAYLEGNGFLFRDFEDKVKGDEKMKEDILKETVKRTIKRLLTEVADFAEAPSLGEDLSTPDAVQPGADATGGKMQGLEQRLNALQLDPQQMQGVMDALEAMGMSSQLAEKKKKDSADRRPPDTPADRLRPLEEGDDEQLDEAMPDHPDVDGDGDKDESISKAQQDRKQGDDDEEKDYSNVPPQLRPSMQKENWVRKPLNERIYKTLIKKWCK